MKKKEIKKVSKISKLFSRFLVCIIIVLIGLISLKSSPNLRNIVYKKIFQNNLGFAKINELYEKFFGSALPLTGSKSNLSLVSSQKLEYSDMVKYKDGVKLTVPKDYAVPVIRSGIVVFVGEKEGYGNTIIIEDSDNVEVWYSGLKEIKTEMYDYLKKGSIIGETNGEELILLFTKEGKNLDYKKYI